MELGIGPFFEKFEESFGRKWLRVLLFFVSLALCSVSVHAIWTYAVQPALMIINLVPARKAFWDSVIFVGSIGAAVIAAAITSNIVLSSFARWKSVRGVKRTLDRSRKLLDEIKLTRTEYAAEISIMFAEIRQIYGQSHETATRLGEFVEELIVQIESSTENNVINFTPELLSQFEKLRPVVQLSKLANQTTQEIADNHLK